CRAQARAPQPRPTGPDRAAALSPAAATDVLKGARGRRRRRCRQGRGTPSGSTDHWTPAPGHSRISGRRPSLHDARHHCGGQRHVASPGTSDSFEGRAGARMTSDGEIWLGDLAWSLRTLEPTAPDTYAAIAELLGLHLPRIKRATDESAHGAEPPDAATTLSDDTPVTESRREAPLSIDTSADIAVVLSPIQTDAPHPRTDWRRVDPLEPFSERHVAPRLPFETLFEERTAPALVAGL